MSSVYYSVGYVTGVALMTAVPVSVAVLLLVPPVRRWWLRPLLRKFTGRHYPPQPRELRLESAPAGVSDHPGGDSIP